MRFPPPTFSLRSHSVAFARFGLIVAVAGLCAAEVSAASSSRPKVPSIPGVSRVPSIFGSRSKPKPAEAPASAPAPAAPAANSAPAPRAETSAAPDPTRTLVALPSLPVGSEQTFAASEMSMAMPDPARLAREEEQRAQALASDLKTIGALDPLPVVGSVEFRKLRADALAIVQRRFQESRAALEADTVTTFTTAVTWSPDFSATARPVAPDDRARARAASYDVAYAVTHLNRPRFIVAYAAAILALDPDSALGAENAASAILSSGERLHPTAAAAANLQPFREDAAVVYRYALACSIDGGTWTMRSVDILTNLGNLYVDLKDAARARPILRAARALAPDSWDAALALASCYEMQGRSELARAALEDKRLVRSSMHAVARRGSRNLEETSASTNLTPQSPEAEIETALQKFDAQEILTAADFVGQLDHATRNRMRAFVDNLPTQGSYKAPGIDGLTQFSTVQAINRPTGIRALGDFSSQLGSYSMLLLSRMMTQSNDALARLGINVQYDVDINDVMAHPEKYKDRKINATVTGADQAQLRARAEAMRRQAEQARRELESGRTDTLLDMGVGVNPILAVYRLKPQHYANPMDVMVQQYNASILAQKMHAYNAYFYAVNDRTRAALTEIAGRYAQKIGEVRAQESVEMGIFQKQRAAAHAAGQDTNNAHWRQLEHNIHANFLPLYNAQTDFAWKEATQVAAKAYETKIKRRAERFYYDVFRHIALISDAHAREKKYLEFEQDLHYAVYHGLLNVLMAFGSYEYREDWDCRCDVGALREQAKREHEELEQIRFEQEQRGRIRFASGDIPESSPLFQKLDAYGTDLDIMFIPALKGRISCARTTLGLALELPTRLSPKLEYTFTENAFTGATTHGGGIGIGVEADEGSVKTSATLNVQGAVSLDGKGRVTDYAVNVKSGVELEVGSTTVSTGGEIGYTPAGGLTSDVTFGVKSSLSDFGRTVEVGIEVSARRGSTFTAKAEQNLTPGATQINEDFEEALEPLGGMFPIDASVTKELWNGQFTL